MLFSFSLEIVNIIPWAETGKRLSSLPLSGSSSKVVLNKDVSVPMPEFSFLSLYSLRHHLEV